MIDKTPYTPGMREVLKLSKAEAGRLGHDYIGPEHYLLGVIRKGDGLAVQTLMNLDVDLEDVKMEIERVLPVMLDVARRLREKYPEARFVAPCVDAAREAQVHELAGDFPLETNVGGMYDVLRAARFCMVC